MFSTSPSKKKSNISALFQRADVTENTPQLESKYGVSSGFGRSEEHTRQQAAARLLPLSPAPCFPPSPEAEKRAEDLSSAVLSKSATSWQIETLLNKLSKSLPPQSHFESAGEPTWKAKNTLVRLVVNNHMPLGYLKAYVVKWQLTAIPSAHHVLLLDLETERWTKCSLWKMIPKIVLLKLLRNYEE